MSSNAWLLHVYKEALEESKSGQQPSSSFPVLQQVAKSTDAASFAEPNVSSMIQFYSDSQVLLFQEVELALCAKKRSALISFLESNDSDSFYSGNACKKMLTVLKSQQANYEEEVAKDSGILSAAELYSQYSEDKYGSSVSASSQSLTQTVQELDEGLIYIPLAKTLVDLHNLWIAMATMEVPKAAKIMHENLQTKPYVMRKFASLVQKDVTRITLKEQITLREVIAKSKKMSKEIYSFWRKNEKEEKEARKRAEKEEIERKKKIEEQREANRQAKKLNFLITQTELYTHFVLKKSNSNDSMHEESNAAEFETHEDTSVSNNVDELNLKDPNIDFDTLSDAMLHEKARRNALDAANASLNKARKFDESFSHSSQPLSLENTPVSEQPKLLTCKLKGYQLKGLNWLANLYEQGINGILADEMGLGKTVQSISLLAYLAERHKIFGPFIVVTPASTLHNWQQEITKFCPSLKVLPYWGNVNDRTMLRKFWNIKKLGQQEAPFHVLVTSYQLIVSDDKHFKRINWQYMILDEAQAIKSSSSLRWKTLLSINCRNRLLLTGTPIQNTMQELWALLHFIMPTLFDSHEEFSEWFSKEIESHAEQKSSLNETQLARLHMILKPFMLRRTKKEVENELASKVEVELFCEMTPLQERMYERIKGKSSIDELLDKVIDFGSGGTGPFRSYAQPSSSITSADKTLMNLVMQLRKVCNHPELFEREETKTPFSFTQKITTCKDGGMDVLYPIQSNPLSIVLPKCCYPSTKIYSNSNMEIKHKSSTSFWSDIERTIQHFKLEGNFNKMSSFIQGELLNDVKEFTPLKRLPRMYYPTAISPMPELFISNSCKQITRSHSFNLNYDNFPKNISFVQVPDPSELILKSGKMILLDSLLLKLKQENHRVLLYFQMTKMISIMEEYLQSKNYRFLRLDGSCKISERRDMVAEFQSNTDIFIFLLSTRAGGLGINLTAADTVIFYDSDWNPTVDQQAMDRAHRLGQTKQVTVYRLITKGTVEERILMRAKQKGEIHKLVVANGITVSEST